MCPLFGMFIQLDFKVINGTNLEANCLRQSRKHMQHPQILMEQAFLFDLLPFF